MVKGRRRTFGGKKNYCILTLLRVFPLPSCDRDDHLPPVYLMHMNLSSRIDRMEVWIIRTDPWDADAQWSLCLICPVIYLSSFVSHVTHSSRPGKRLNVFFLKTSVSRRSQVTLINVFTRVFRQILRRTKPRTHYVEQNKQDGSKGALRCHIKTVEEVGKKN